MTTLEKARSKYRLGETRFMDLHKVFMDCATNEDKDRFFSSPVYDRPGVVEGKTKETIDAEWAVFLTKLESYK